MNKFKNLLLIPAFGLLTCSLVFGQAERNPTQPKIKEPTKSPIIKDETNVNTENIPSVPDTRGYNPNSVRPIHESNIMYKRTVWRNVDLNEKQNRPFMSANNEISKVIIDGVKSGKVTAYTSDSLHTKMSIADFRSAITDPSSSQRDFDAEIADVKQQMKDGWIKKPEGDKKIKDIENARNGGGGDELLASQLSQMEIKEDMIFDKQRSRLYYDIQTITIYLPGTKNKLTGTDKRIASFRYKDLVKYFKNTPTAIWYNEQNNRGHLNLSDAFDLRMFASMIIKISNPRDESLETIYGDKNVRPMVASQQLEYKLMEYEHNLWEF